MEPLNIRQPIQTQRHLAAIILRALRNLQREEANPLMRCIRVCFKSPINLNNQRLKNIYNLEKLIKSKIDRRLTRIIKLTNYQGTF